MIGPTMVTIQFLLLLLSWDGVKSPLRASFMRGIVVGIGVYSFGLLLWR